MLRSRVLLEARAVRRRVELCWLLEYNRLAGGGISNAHSLRGGNADAAPERALQWQQKSRDDCLGRHPCFVGRKRAAKADEAGDVEPVVGASDAKSCCAAGVCSEKLQRL